MKLSIMIITAIIALLIITTISACASLTRVDEVQIQTTISPTFTSTPRPTPTPEPGRSRSNPIPLGSTLNTKGESIEILEVFRRAEENDLMLFKSFLRENEEYIIVNIRVNCIKNQDSVCHISQFNFSMVGNDGMVIRADQPTLDATYLVLELKDTLRNVELYGGGSITTNLVFVISENLTDLLLIYDPYYDQNKYFLSIE